MNDNDANHGIDDELHEWAWDIVAKHDIGLRAQEPRGGALVLTADARDLLQEIVDTVIRERWFTPTIRRRLHRAIDMLIDAERLSSIPH